MMMKFHLMIFVFEIIIKLNALRMIEKIQLCIKNKINVWFVKDDIYINHYITGQRAVNNL